MEPRQRRVRRALYSITGLERQDISLSVTRDCGRRYLEQYRTAESRYHAAGKSRKTEVGMSIVPSCFAHSLAPPGSLSPKISSLHRRSGSSGLPATADFSATAHNGHVMRCVVKNGLVEKRNPFLLLPRKHSGMSLQRRYILSAITDHADRSSEGDLKFTTGRINYRLNSPPTR